VDTKSLNAILFLALLVIALLTLSGKLDVRSLIPTSISKAVLQWRLGWIFLGATIAFVIVWGKKLAPDKALWGAIICAVLAYLFL
jgi:hypothetical protein